MDQLGQIDIAALQSVVYDERIRQLVALHAPRTWTVEFLSRLRDSLLMALRPSKKKQRSFDYSSLSRSQMERAVGACESICQRLSASAVKEWYTKHELRFAQ
jgi:hypothetical protein